MDGFTTVVRDMTPTNARTRSTPEPSCSDCTAAKGSCPYPASRRTGNQPHLGGKVTALGLTRNGLHSSRFLLFLPSATPTGRLGQRQLPLESSPHIHSPRASTSARLPPSSCSCSSCTCGCRRLERRHHGSPSADGKPRTRPQTFLFLLPSPSSQVVVWLVVRLRGKMDSATARCGRTIAIDFTDRSVTKRIPSNAPKYRH